MMTLLAKTKLSNKKFYSKWVYKASFKLPGAAVLRVYDLGKLEDILNSNEKYPHHYLVDAKKNKEDLIKLANFLNSTKVPYAKRIESSLVDVYTNDKDFLEEISKLLENKLYFKYYPFSKKIETDNENNIFVKKIPHNKYLYKVYLRPHKFNGDIASKKQFISWVEGQNKILISERVKSWFISMNWNWDRRYLYVEDDKTLLFLQLRSPDAVGRIHKYSVVDK